MVNLANGSQSGSGSSSGFRAGSNSFAHRHGWSTSNGRWDGNQWSNSGSWSNNNGGRSSSFYGNNYGSRYGSYGFNNYGNRYYGYRGYGYGYRPYGYGLYGSLITRVLLGTAFGGYGNYGYGYGGYGYAPYSYGYSYGTAYPTTTYYSSPTYVTNVVPPTDVVVDPAIAPAAQPAAGDYATLGETAFRNGDYEDAVRNWQHALVDDPQNATLGLLMGQALFAQGRYDDAAGAIQAALAAMPTDQWNIVVANAAELYGDPAKLTTQVAALEASAVKTPGPASQFLLGYFHGYLGNPARAVTDLDAGTKLQPQDQLMQKLREVMQEKVAAAAKM